MSQVESKSVDCGGRLNPAERSHPDTEACPDTVGTAPGETEGSVAEPAAAAGPARDKGRRR